MSLRSTTVTSQVKMLRPYEPVVEGYKQAVTFLPSLTWLEPGVVVGQVTASGLFGRYEAAAADGRQAALGLTMYPVKTDASGNLTGTVNNKNVIYEDSGTIYCYQWTFKTSDIKIVDAAGVALPQGANQAAYNAVFAQLGKVVNGILYM